MKRLTKFGLLNVFYARLPTLAGSERDSLYYDRSYTSPPQPPPSPGRYMCASTRQWYCVWRLQ